MRRTTRRYPLGAVRSFLLLAIVAAISLLAGIAVTGLPETRARRRGGLRHQHDNGRFHLDHAGPGDECAANRGADRVERVDRHEADRRDRGGCDHSTAAPTTLAPESSVRVVVANASDASGIASRTADEFRGLGYSTVSATNAASVRPDTVVVFAPGFEAEAARLASQLQVPPEQITAQTDGPLTINDTPGDLWVLLGFDRS